MSVENDARTVRIDELTSFSPDARVNREVMVASNLVTRMNCYEPGQVTPMHKHPDEDETMYVVEGRGKVTFEDREDLPIETGDLVCLPADQFHQIIAGDDNRMVLIYFMKPDYRTVRPDNKVMYTSVGELHGEVPPEER